MPGSIAKRFRVHGRDFENNGLRLGGIVDHLANAQRVEAGSVTNSSSGSVRVCDPQLSAADKTRLIRNEKEHQVRDVLRIAEARSGVCIIAHARRVGIAQQRSVIGVNTPSG